MRIAKVFGITIKVNIFFLALFILLFMAGKHIEGMIAFGVVMLHELAHVITAVNYGFSVSEVELLPYGGVAKLEQGLEGDPYAEVFVAVAGPLANFCIIGLIFILHSLGFGNQQWVPFFIECNLTLGLFNLLPAYPLDGGRIYRAALATRLGVKAAVDRVLMVSRGIALVMIILGLGVFILGFNGFNMIIIGGFLFFEHFREKTNTMFTFMKYLNRKQGDLSLQRMMLARQVVAYEEVELKEVVRYFVPKKYHLVVRIDGSYRITGMFTENEIISKIMEGKINSTLGEL